MECLDLIDENGNLTGEIASRKDVHKLGLLHHASGLIICGGGRILSQQRSFRKEKNAGLWDMSASGHVQSGQGLIESLLREVKEELDLDIKEEELKLLGKFWRHEVHRSDFIENELDYIYILEKDVDINKIKVQKEEVEQVAWISFSKFKEMLENGEAVSRVGVWDALFEYMEKE